MADFENLFAKKDPPPDIMSKATKELESKTSDNPEVVELHEDAGDTQGEVNIILAHMAAIERDHFGIGNIPVNHEYYKTLRPRLQELQHLLSLK